jgi:hypothetical protein
MKWPMGRDPALPRIQIASAQPQDDRLPCYEDENDKTQVVQCCCCCRGEEDDSVEW